MPDPAGQSACRSGYPVNSFSNTVLASFSILLVVSGQCPLLDPAITACLPGRGDRAALDFDVARHSRFPRQGHGRRRTQAIAGRSGRVAEPDPSAVGRATPRIRCARTAIRRHVTVIDSSSCLILHAWLSPSWTHGHQGGGDHATRSSHRPEHLATKVDNHHGFYVVSWFSSRIASARLKISGRLKNPSLFWDAGVAAGAPPAQNSGGRIFPNETRIGGPSAPDPLQPCSRAG